MAHCKKFTRAACGHIFKHYERAKDENGEYIKFGNQDIVQDKTHLNYNLAPIQRNGQGNFVKERCSEVKMQNRADVNVMCSWVVTAPKEIREEELNTFFKETYKFLSERYGKENVVSAYIHMDETTPHIHFAFVPVVMDKKKNILKVSAKEAIDKKELSIFHQDLSSHMENVFGRDVGLINEATKDGNKTKKELQIAEAEKNLEELKREAAELQKQNANSAQELQKITERIKSHEKEVQGLYAKIRALETIFKGKQLTADDLDKIVPLDGMFGSIKNITMADIKNLKKMAIGNIKKETELEDAEQEVARLTKDNARLKSQVPTIKQQMAQSEERGRLIDTNKKLVDDYNRLSDRYNLLVDAVNQLPEEELEFVKNIVEPPNPPGDNERTYSYDYDDDLEI